MKPEALSKSTTNEDRIRLYGWACSVLQSEVEGGAWGRVVVEIRDGKVVRIEAVRSLEPPVRVDG
jgi:hypothetical protein